MIRDLQKKYRKLKKQGLTSQQELNIRRELDIFARQYAERKAARPDTPCCSGSLPDLGAADSWPRAAAMNMGTFVSARSLDDLMARDKQREEDGLPRKIRLGKVIKPGGKKDDRVIVVPTTVEEKFLHDSAAIVEEGQGFRAWRIWRRRGRRHYR